MSATILPFPMDASQRLVSWVRLQTLAGETIASAGFLPGAQNDIWTWIAGRVAEWTGCNPEDVHADDDTVTVDGLPCYLVEIVPPARSARKKGEVPDFSR